MEVTFKSIGVLRTRPGKVPRHWTLSDLEGELVVDEAYLPGLKDIQPGQEIVVLFHFHEIEPFSEDDLIQHPAHLDREWGVFSLCSPRRPNPIGLSTLEVTAVKGNVISVRRVDMLDGTPILDIKPPPKMKA
jgi:tRNA (adenine37-N6)-methyltransferase